MKRRNLPLPEPELRAIQRAADDIIAEGGRTLLSKILKGSKERKLLVGVGSWKMYISSIASRGGELRILRLQSVNRKAQSTDPLGTVFLLYIRCIN